MHSAAAIFVAGLLLGAFALADGVPRCWQADNPGQDIEDGLFLVLIPTADRNASSVARVLGILNESAASQAGVGTRGALDQIEIDMYGNIKNWQSTSTFPTLDSFKTYIVNSLSPALSEPGVSVTCATVGHPSPAPIEH